jgi:hypothetical protein
MQFICEVISMSSELKTRQEGGSVMQAVELGANEGREAMEKLFSFPDISYANYKTLPRYFQARLLERNKITNTDTYNRTMLELLTDREWEVDQETLFDLNRMGGQGTMSLQMRRSPFNYIVGVWSSGDARSTAIN